MTSALEGAPLWQPDTDAYLYGGRRLERADAVAELRAGMPASGDVVALSVEPSSALPAGALPRTFNGKKLEVPIKRILSGVPVAQAVSIDSIDNPEALGFFVSFLERR